MYVLTTSEISQIGTLGVFWSSELHTILWNSQAAPKAS